MKSVARIVAAVAASLVLMACTAPTDPFIIEHDALSGQRTANGDEYLAVDVPEDHRFETASEDQIRRLLEGGDGAIYFGFPECPWCRVAVPVMNEAATAVHLEEIHYLNVRQIRDQKARTAEGQIVVDEEGTEFYQYLLEELGDFAPEYAALEDPTERRILVPLVAAVVGGNVVEVHLGTVASHTDPYAPLTEEQKSELLGVYKGLFTRISGCGEQFCE